MAVFEYNALNQKGKKTSGIIDAESISAAKEKLNLQNLFPVSLEKIEAKMSKNKRSKFHLPVFTRISSSEITMFTRQAATLLSAGFPLVKAVATLAPLTKTKAFQRILSRVKDAIEEGNSFAEALAAHPEAFSPVYINMVRAGESSGTLEIVLERLADFSEKKEDTQKKIQTSLAYPLFMAFFGFLVVVFLLVYIVPTITNIFKNMNQALPLPTQMLLYISDFVQNFWWLIIPAPAIIMVCFYLIRKTEKGGTIIDKAIISMPVTGTLIKKIIAARFSRTLGSLLANGVTMMTALEICQTISGNRIVANLIKKAATTVEQGGMLGATLEKSNAFPPLASQMIKVGEKSGEMEKMLEKSAELFDRDVQNAVSAATSVLEPVIILLMGVVIAFIILAVCLPIFEINQSIS